ncbi:alpha/beta fold hydrolase [Zhouia sp. PK063]|uniref:alpha/beta fold hydrolase n=1 Tax=Zhouia sp. PK063 TaxID=3373602 RepID=UPI0037B861AB
MQLVHSQIIGEGKPLIILHGFLGMLDNWKTLGNKYASEGFQVHLIDQRNHGRSFHSNDFSYQFMANDLLNYCNQHYLDKVDVIGHSMGGKTAMLFATQHPEKINKLIIADIAPKYYPVHHQTILDGLNAIPLKTLSSRDEAEEILSQYVKDKPSRMFLLKNLYHETKESYAFRFNLPVLTLHIDEVGQALPASAQFTGTTLFLKGERSNYIKKEDENDILKHFPNSSIETIEKSGHWVHAENQKQFFNKTVKFLFS